MAVGGGSWIRVSATATGLDARNMNREIRTILGRKVDSITKDPLLRQYIGQVYVGVVTPYVPVDTGKLRASGRATEDGRVYWTAVSPIKVARDGHTYGGYNYAAIQYNVPMRHKDPNATDHWTDKVRPGTPDWSTFISEITPEIIRRF